MAIIIIGGGIIGLTVGRELLKRGCDNLLILEKEEGIGYHASGRNSGVLHAGIYYHSSSLKARFCLEGNKLMSEFCLERGLPYKRCGKVVVTKNEGEINLLYELERRGKTSRAEVKIIDEKELMEIEPYASTKGKALYIPQTGIVDPLKILEELLKEIKLKKGRVLFKTKVLGVKNSRKILTNAGEIEYELLINCAGAWSDRIAHSEGIGKEFQILPFRGHYFILRENKTHLVRSNIYPVPDLRNPFLGVHLTKTIEGKVYAGPTATPAFGRENYYGLKKIFPEFLRIIYNDLILFLKSPSFRQLAKEEIGKILFQGVFRESKALLPLLEKGDLLPSNKRGIRAQLINLREKKLVDDFLILKGERSLHILNAVSPAFTSSMAFAKYIIDEAERII